MGCMCFGCAHLLPQVAWNKRDLLAYAVGIGAKNDEFQFIYGASFKHILFFKSILTIHPIALELGETAAASQHFGFL